uniref:helix-turn-helix domain-containing protein n=1 Tax=Phocaeicola massiliensis TaxID=204516 RepID=UPI0040285513
MYRDAANNVDCLLHKYQKLYYSTPKDDIYVMVLLDLSIKNEEYRISEKKRECEKFCPPRYIPLRESGKPKDYLKIIERIKELMQREKLSTWEFARKAGLSPTSFFWTLKGERELDLSTILSIKKGFPKLQLDWILGLTDSYSDTHEKIEI